MFSERSSVVSMWFYAAVVGALPEILLPLFWNFWKFQGIWLRSGKRRKVRERSGNLCSQGNSIVAAQQNNSPVLYSYCSLFFIRDFRGEFGLINVRLFDILPAISSAKVGDFFLSGEW